MDIQPGIAKGLLYLQRTQAKDGHFDTYYSASVSPFRAEAPYRTTFLPSLILEALSQVDGAGQVRGALAAWLLQQHSPQWSFNYWAVDAPERARMAYPDDLDDTFCALAGLFSHDPKLVDAEALGKIVRLLLATESKVGGPYRTWLMPPTAPKVWLDVDLAVNANVAYFLRLAAQPLPNVTALMEKAIAAGKYESPYYPSPLPIMYYLARAYRGGQQQVLAAQILALQTPAGHWGSPMRTALMLSALDELGSAVPQPKALSYTLRSQQADGSWPAEPFWLEVKYTLSGSPELSTALILEALQRHVPAPATGTPQKRDRRGQQLIRQITATVLERGTALPPALRAQAGPTLQHMIAGDTNREIMLLPHFFAASLRESATVSVAALRHLGLANLYGWTAYTLYDDILDDSGDVRLLSLANTTLRWSLEEFRCAVPNPAYLQFVAQTFEIIDNANAWEVMHCRFSLFDGNVGIGALPKYGTLGKLAERSLGHALTPLGVLVLGGAAPDDPRAQSLVRALKHYLIARQLGDDMRDWEEDLRAGQCSYVVAKLLAACRIAPGTYPLDTLIPTLQAEAWKHTLAAVGTAVLRHIARARKDLRASTLVTRGSPVGQLLTDLEDTTNQTLAAHADAKTFLQAYQP